MSFNYLWPVEHLPLFKQILELCKAPFTVPPSEIEFVHGVTADSDPAGNVTYNIVKNMLEPWQEGQWYPHWPKLRSCKLYEKYYTAVPEPANCEYNSKN